MHLRCAWSRRWCIEFHLSSLDDDFVRRLGALGNRGQVRVFENFGNFSFGFLVSEDWALFYDLVAIEKMQPCRCIVE